MTRLEALRTVLRYQPQLWRRPVRAWQLAMSIRSLRRQIFELGDQATAAVRDIEEVFAAGPIDEVA